MKKGTKGIRRVFTGQNEYFVFDLDEDAFGKRKRLYAKTEGELKEKIAAAQSERKAAVSHYKPKTNQLSDYVRFYFKNAVGSVAARDIKRLLTLFENAVFASELDRDISTITSQELQDFYDALAEKFPRKRIEEIDTVLRKTFAISNEDKLTDFSFDGIIIPEEKERASIDYILSPDEFERLVTFCIEDNCTRYGRNEQLIIMCMLTGWKLSSLKKLTAGNIDLEQGIAVIEGRQVPLSDRCTEWLASQSENGSLPVLSPKEGIDKEAVLFINSNKVSPTLQSVQSTLFSITSNCGLPKGITGKTLCKSYVVYEAEKGVSLDILCGKLQYRNKTAIANILDEYEVRKALF